MNNYLLCRNGLYFKENRVGFKNVRLCQEIQCKLEVDGEMKYLHFDEKIRTKKCETCTCKKFGQVPFFCIRPSQSIGSKLQVHKTYWHVTSRLCFRLSVSVTTNLTSSVPRMKLRNSTRSAARGMKTTYDHFKPNSVLIWWNVKRIIWTWLRHSSSRS